MNEVLLAMAAGFYRLGVVFFPRCRISPPVLSGVKWDRRVYLGHCLPWILTRFFFGLVQRWICQV